MVDQVPSKYPWQCGINLEQFFDPDSPSGEPVLQQVRDPFTEEVHGPGMKVDQHGNVTFFDEEK